MTDASIAAPNAVAAPQAEPLLRYTLWPHRSLSRSGFGYVMLGATLISSVPLYAIIGTTAFWIVGAFALLELGLLYGMIGLTYRTGRVRELIELWPDRLRIERIEPNGKSRVWEANPYWVTVSLHNTRRIESYLVLSSSGREIELGAFLTPEERRSLAEDLELGLVRAKSAAARI